MHPAWLRRAGDLCHAARTSLAGKYQAQAKISPTYAGARGSLQHRQSVWNAIATLGPVTSTMAGFGPGPF
jgi:predicted RNA polymerase sigma factor